MKAGPKFLYTSPDATTGFGGSELSPVNIGIGIAPRTGEAEASSKSYPEKCSICYLSMGERTYINVLAREPARILPCLVALPQLPEIILHVRLRQSRNERRP